MKNPKKSVLGLNSETVRHIARTDLSRAGGGAPALSQGGIECSANPEATCIPKDTWSAYCPD